MRIIDADGARRLDAEAIRLGLSVEVLMENAALAVVEVIAKRFPRVEAVGVLCGPGSNGGDGYAVARHLHSRGVRPVVVSTHPRTEAGGPVARQRALVERLGIGVHDLPGDTKVESADPAADLAETFRGCDLVVDAMLGTGCRRPLEGTMAACAEAITRMGIRVLAIDVPTGINASQAEILGPTVRADLTVSFFAPKVAHVLPPARDTCGEVWVSRLGLSRDLVEGYCRTWFLSRGNEIESIVRSADSHKGTFGHLLVVAGSRGMSGAAILTARAALRSGAGLVTVAVPEDALDEVMNGVVEAMGVALPAVDGILTSAAAGRLADLFSGRDAMVIGPGLGRDEVLAEWVRSTVMACPIPVILDADGIMAFSGRGQDLRDRPGTTVLTPHPREMASLLGCPVPRGGDERAAAALKAAEITGGIIVLKGHRTLVATPAGELHVNPTGNSGMATAGSGDVLAGMMGAELMSDPDPVSGAVRAVFLHGLSGDLGTAFWGAEGLVATDLIDGLPKARRTLEAAACSREQQSACSKEQQSVCSKEQQSACSKEALGGLYLLEPS